MALYVSVGAIAALLSAALAIRIEHRSLEKRATVLFGGLRDLELRKSTRSEAMAIVKRSAVPFIERGACPTSNCNIDIYLRDFAWRHIDFFAAHQWMLRMYEFLRGHPVRINATVSIINGIVWGKDFTLQIEVPPEKNGFFGGYGYVLLAVFETRSSFYPRTSPPLSHPEYEIGRPGGCEGCILGWVYFTPYAESADVRRLMQVNLSCVSRWTPCREQADIMPVPWSEYTSELNEVEDARIDIRKCPATLIPLLGRDSQNVAVADPVRSRVEGPAGDSFQVTTFRLIQRLKRAQKWVNGESRDVRVFNNLVALSKTNSPRDVKPGEPFILMYETGKRAGPTGPEVWPEICGVIPATKENLALVQSGIDRDFRAKFPSPEHVPF